MKRRLNAIVLASLLSALSTSCKDQEFYEKEIYETFDDQVQESLPSESETETVQKDGITEYFYDNIDSDEEDIYIGNTGDETHDEYEYEDDNEDDHESDHENDHEDDHVCSNDEETENHEQTTPILQDENPELVLVTDEFIQNGQNSKIDILWVVDNSGSMEDEQADLAYNFDVFIKDFITKDIDFKMAITTTDTSRRNAGRASYGSISALTKSKLDQNKDQFLANFAQMIQVGTSGSGYEKGLKAASSFAQRYDSSFFREDAFFVTVFVTDEDDQSEEAPSVYVSKIKDQLNDASKIKFYSIVSHSQQDANRWFTPGHQRYLEATELTGGKVSDIDNNFYEILQEMGQSIAKLTESFSLKTKPANEQIKVYVNGSEVIGGWSYDADARTISFNENSIPKAGQQIKVEYFIKK